MMEASPAAPFVMSEPPLPLEVLVIALDAPAHLGHAGEGGGGFETALPFFGRTKGRVRRLRALGASTETRLEQSHRAVWRGDTIST